ncbi:MAG: guanylate kinase [Arenicella sp.]|nr:guanylate kinase [Arenicella sp.]
MAGKLFIISAPSGAGKTSLARALIANNANIVMSISHTTRQKRAGETEGEDYYFVDQAEFLNMVDDDLFLEYAQVYGNYYGTSRIVVEQLLASGRNVLLDIDWQGAASVRNIMPGAVSITILPPSVQELERRLRSRGSDSEDVIQSRMRQAMDEMKHCSASDHVVLNDDFNAALADLELIVAGQSDKLRPLSIDLDKLLGAQHASQGRD